MKKTLKLFIIGGFVLVAVAFFSWREHVYQQNGIPAQIVIVIDRSNSTFDRCASLLGLVDHAFDLPNVRQGSNITVLGTGDSKTTNEPVLIHSFTVPSSNRVLEGRDRQANARTEILKYLFKHCHDVSETNSSPLLLAVKRSVEQLKALGCSPESQCKVFIQTDGQETADYWLKQAIKNKKGIAVKPKLQIDNSVFQIEFCGLSETKEKGKRTSVQESRQLKTAWQAVFRQPERIGFRPFCPKLALEEKE